MCISQSTQSKIHFYICFRLLLFLPIIKGSGYGFGDNVQDVLFQKIVLGLLLMRLQAVVREMSDVLAVVALPSFRSCLL